MRFKCSNAPDDDKWYLDNHLVPTASWEKEAGTMVQTNQFIYSTDMVQKNVGKAALYLIPADANEGLFAQALNVLVNWGFKTANAGDLTY